MKNSSSKDTVKNAKKAFFVGIGGISMASLARYFKATGRAACGSDRTESAATRSLRNDGIDVFIGHRAENIDGCDLVVYTAAIPSDNPELLAAGKKNVPTLTRAEFLGALMADYRVRIGISGSHGKSTATAMAAKLMLDAGRDPTVMCGADTAEMGGAYRIGANKRDFLFEACEYRDSFLSLTPNVAVLLNVDLDHTDYFDGIDSVVRSFKKFARISSDDGGAVIACADDAGAMRAAEDEFAITFGVDNESDYRAADVKTVGGYASFRVTRFDEPYIENITLSVPGYHNVYNALANVALGDLLGIPADTIASSLSGFHGLSRRFEKKKSIGGADVYIDYAHHPREIEATLLTARQLCRGKLITVFEPHTYSRTKALFDGFARAFDKADIKMFTDIFPARETDTLGVSSKMLAEAAGGEYADSYASAARRIREVAADGDLIMILGAGSINTLADMLGG